MSRRLQRLVPDAPLFDVAMLEGSGGRLTCPGCSRPRAALLLVRRFGKTDALCASCDRSQRRATRRISHFPKMQTGSESCESAPVLTNPTDGPSEQTGAA
jgi:hypothetical protein